VPKDVEKTTTETALVVVFLHFDTSFATVLLHFSFVIKEELDLIPE
jgi:hypothetical protein